MRSSAREWGEGFEDGRRGVNDSSKWPSTSYQEGQMAGSPLHGGEQSSGNQEGNQQ